VRPAALAFGGWGLWVGTLALVLLIWGEATVPLIAFGAAAAGAAIIAGYLALSSLQADPPRTVSDASLSPPLIGAGIVLACNGLAFGLWLILIGAEVAAFGIGLLVAETRRGRAR
jgi:hypothetical protein